MAKKNNRTTNQNLKDEYKKKYASSKELSDASKSDMSRASSIIPASALYDSIRRSEKRMSSNSENVKNIQPIRGIIDWTNGSTQGWDLLASQSLPTPENLLLLDTYSGAAAAYSLRKLRTDYSGSAIRVRESGGNTEADIGFDSNGDLDTVALLAHCGANDGFVATWYDQSGNGNDISNPVVTSQAKIVNTGSVVTLNSKPAFDSEGITTFNLSSSNTQLWTGNKSYSMFSAFGLSGVVSTQHLSTYIGGSPDTYRLAMLSGNNLRLQSFDNSGGNSLSSATVSTNANFIASIFRTQSTTQVFANNVGGTEITGLNPPAEPTTTSDFSYGGLGSSFVFQGLSTEFIIYALDQTSNRSAIEANINEYYTIY